MSIPTTAEQQQELLELTNRMRLRPASELDILLNAAQPGDPTYDSYIESNIKGFKVDTSETGGLKSQWKNLQPVAALAWSSQLTQAAKNHNDAMIAANQQTHQVKTYDAAGKLIYEEKNRQGRFADVQYVSNGQAGENVYAYGETVLHTHAGFAIDWGDDRGAKDGIQREVEADGSVVLAGHRVVTMAAGLREVGISISPVTPVKITDVGPLVVTENFGSRTALNQKAYVLGVAFQDKNSDGWYTAGEGFKPGEIQVKIAGINGTSFSNTVEVTETGSYQELLDPGEYQVDFIRKSTGSIVGSQNIFVNANKADNIKVDLIADNSNKFKTNLVLPVVKLGSNIQTGGLESKVIDFRVDNTASTPLDLNNKKIDTIFTGVSADAAYHNYGGLYRVEDSRGTVIDPIDNKSYQPGDNNYISAALRASKNVVTELDRNGRASSFNLTGGYLYAPFLVADGRVDDVLNSQNPATAPHVYFNYVKANIDGINHVKLLGANKFGFEDMLGGGDRDYNDLIFQVDGKVS